MEVVDLVVVSFDVVGNVEAEVDVVDLVVVWSVDVVDAVV